MPPLRQSLHLLAVLFLTCALALPAWAADSNEPAAAAPQSAYGKGVALVQQEDYAAAIEEFDAALAEDPEDADTLNYLGYAHRKLGNYEQAEAYYLRALEQEPEHRGANEYLGELYLETDRLALAEERLAVLDDACFFGCEEYDELEEAIEAYKAAN